MLYVAVVDSFLRLFYILKYEHSMVYPFYYWLDILVGLMTIMNNAARAILISLEKIVQICTRMQTVV